MSKAKLANKLTLDQDHVYRLNKRVLPSVTQILQDVFGQRPYWSEWHRNKGSAVHLAINLLVNNKLDWQTVDDRIKGKIRAFQKLLRDTGWIVEESELSLYSRIYQFAGTLDLIFRDNNKRILADIKSSKEPLVELQLAGYNVLWESNRRTKLHKECAIYLNDNGTYKLDWIKDIKASKKIFISCLMVSNWQRTNY